jgi:hypothetical protein
MSMKRTPGGNIDYSIHSHTFSTRYGNRHRLGTSF